VRSYKALAILLSYPQPRWLEALGEVDEVLRRELLRNRGAARRVEPLMTHLRTASVIDAQAHYVQVFDNTPEHSLHLFEHLHGESRDRGQAMVELTGEYRRYGLQLSCRELPDHLPVYLEFLAQLPAREAGRRLGQFVDVLALLGSGLSTAQSPYAGVLQALTRMAKGRRRGIASAPPAAGAGIAMHAMGQVRGEYS